MAKCKALPGSAVKGLSLNRLKHVVIHKVVRKHPSREVSNSVAVLLQIHLGICVPKIVKIDCVFTKLLKR